jgi:hypothetical protein
VTIESIPAWDDGTPCRKVAVMTGWMLAVAREKRQLADLKFGQLL